MAKKFFYNRVYNTKKMIINGIIIGISVIGIIVCFIVTSNFQGSGKKEPEGQLSIKKETTVEINEEIAKDVFFSKIENVNLDKIQINYPEGFENTKTGRYDIEIVVDGKKYNSTLVIVDTKKPELALKEITIKENASYTAQNFVDSCTDNSGEECKIAFYTEGVDEEGKAVAYDAYKKAGTYSIKIVASDTAGNQNVQETKLTIDKTATETPTVTPPSQEEKPVNCKYGNGEYDDSTYLLVVSITSNNCAVSLDLYKDATMTSDINKLMESETTRIKRDVEKTNPIGTIAINRKVNAIVNKTGNGIVGYELRIIVTVTKNGESETIADFKINKDGKRVYTINVYNLPE